MTYTLFKGTSFKLDDSVDDSTALAYIAELPMVKKMWPVTWSQTIPVAPDANAASEALSAPPLLRRQSTSGTYPPHVMTQVDKLHAKGITGKGIHVGIVDSGIDYKHPALGGCFGPGCVVTTGYDFVDRDADPMDPCEGHGTHVAGIIAAQPNLWGFTGAAPGVTLGAYRANNCAGTVPDDRLVAAFNRAFDDGCDIINFSGVLPWSWSEHPTSVAVQRIVDRGVPCVAAMGNMNEANTGLFTAGSPAVGRGVAGIANFINTETPAFLTAATYSVDGQTDATSFGWRAGTPRSHRSTCLSTPSATAAGSPTTPAGLCRATPPTFPTF
jgi:subtilisin family serine protease